MMVHASPENTNELDKWLSGKPLGQKVVVYLAQVRFPPQQMNST
jgi:hypothetical protein